ncbi:MAG: PspC domain-containing protein [Coriobacteriia bacterium]|nr:PspC domain-containing protein [Coriobacteriia bacterium]
MADGRKLYRSRTERMIAGVCGGIADYYQLDPTVVRIIAVLLAVVGNAAAVIAYAIMWIVVPEESVAGASSLAGGPEAQPEDSLGAGPMVAPMPPEPPRPPTPPKPPEVERPPIPPAPAAPLAPPPTARGRGGTVWIGMILVVLGALIIAARLVPEVNVWALWPVVVILLGVRTMVTPDSKGSWNVNRLIEGLTGVFVGGVFLANTTGALGWSVWLSVVSLWPLLLIAAGLDIIGKGLDNLWLRTLSSLVVLFGILIGVFVLYQRPFSLSMGLFGPLASHTEYSEPADPGVRSASADIEAPVGRITIESGDDLLSASIDSPFDTEFTSAKMGDSVDIALSAGSGGPALVYRGDAGMDLQLSDDVEWELSVDAAASALDADFSDIDVRELSIGTGVTDARVKLGKPARGAGTIDVSVSSGVSSVTIRLPKGTEARVSATGGLAVVDTPDGGGLTIGERTWASSGFDEARDRYDISVATGLAEVRVQYY